MSEKNKTEDDHVALSHDSSLAKNKTLSDALVNSFKSAKNKLASHVGPGLISGVAANDAGSIATLSIIGAAFGYKFLWILVLSIPMFLVLQEMSMKVASISKKGLGAIIRERYGVKTSLVITLALFITNVTIVAANLGGVVASIELLTHIPATLLVVPVGVIVWVFVAKGNYKRVEKFLLILALGLLLYIITGILISPNWSDIVGNIVVPSFQFDYTFLLMIVALLGATLSPYVYYMEAGAEVEKGNLSKERTTKVAKFDVMMGASISVIVSFFIMVVSATVLFPQFGGTGHNLETASEVALALKPLAGDYAFILFAIGLFAASLIATSVLPISTAYAIAETFGYESSIEKIKEAKLFKIVFTVTLAIGALFILAGINIVNMMFISMFISGLTAPLVIFLLLKACNDPNYVGAETNGRIYNLIGWATVALSTVMIVLLIIGYIFAPQNLVIL